MIRNILSAVLAVAIAVQPIAASAQQMPFYRHNVQGATGTSGGGTVTPPPNTGNTTEPVRGTGDLAIYLPVQIRARYGVPFSLQIVASNAEGAVTWTNVGSALPQGLTFNPANGFVTGTPTRIESSRSVRFAGVDSTGKAGESPSLVVDVQPVPTVTVQANYTGRTGEVTTIVPQASPVYGSQTWNVVGTLPLGLSLNPATGRISGTARQQGTYAGLRLHVTDADGASGTSNPFTITINSNISIAGLPSSIPVRLSQAMTQVRPFASGTPGPYQWSVSPEGTPLPDGLSINPTTGAINGTPTAAGTTTGIALRIVDSTTGYSTISPPFAVAVAAPPSISVANAYNVRQGQNSVVNLAPVGNNLLGGGYWTVANKPAPYALDVFSGRLSGNTAGLATYPNVTFSVVDLFDGARATSTPTTLNIWPALSLGTPAVPAARVGTPFTMQPGPVSGVVGSPTWSVGGNLPDGLSIDPATGVISGTPTTVQVSTLTQTVVDSADGASRTTQNAFTINVLPPEAEIPFEIVGIPSEIPGATEKFLRITPTVTGARGTVTWTLQGSLPTWALFDSSTGIIAGVPDAIGTISGLRYSVTDTANGAATSSQTFSIVIAPSAPMTASMPSTLQAMVGETFSASPPTMTNVAAPLTYTLVSGTLPEGLSLNSSTGAISGIPEVSGEVTGLMIGATDDPGNSAATNQFSIVVSPSSTSPAIAMASRTLTTGETFTATPSVQNSNAPATWILESGTLPPWATLNASTGSIAGTPPEQGTIGPLVLRVTDRFARSARTAPFSFTIVDAPQFGATMPTLVPGVVGSTFSTSPSVVGARGATAWSVSSGTLPAGLALNVASGTISGLPATSGTFSGIVLSARDSTNLSVSTNAFTIVISPSPLSMQAYANEIRATYLTPFTAPAPVVGGAVGSVSWSLASGTLPGWATLDASTGRIVGTPDALSTTPGIRLRATDANGTNAQTNPFTLVVQRPAFTVSVAPSNGYHVNDPVVISPASSGLVGTPTWTLTSGVLPSGLTLDASTGTISGTLSTPATATNLALSVRDSFDGTSATSAPFSISVLAQPSISVLTSYQGGRNASFLASPVANNVFGALTWSLAGGVLPPWATLDPSTGTISGTPPDEATYPGISVRVTDSANGSAVSQPFAIVVGSGMYATTLATTYNPRVGKAFATDAPIVFRNSGAVAWSLASGTIPAGLSLDQATGVISGTPTTPSTTTLTLRMTDASTATAVTQALTFETSPAPTVTYASTSLRVGASLTLAPTVTDARGSQSWAVASGTLPAWATLDPNTGTISGVPTEVGSFTLAIRVTDGDSTSGTSSSFSIAATQGLTVSNKAPSYGGRINQAFSMAPVTIGNAIGTLSWSLAPNSGIPSGLGVNASTGALVGTPAVSGGPTVNVVVRDSSDQAMLVVPYTLAIAGELRVGPLGTLQYHEARQFSTPAPTVTGQRGTLTWSLASGSLPGWLTLDAQTGMLSGTAPATGTFGPFGLVATDSADSIVSAPSSLTVSIVGALGVAQLPTSFTARFGMAFTSARPNAVNAVGTATWTWGAGSSPPSWLTLDPSTGILTGTPTQLGTTSGLTLVVTDATGALASSAPFTLNVFSQPDVAVSAYTLKQRVGDPVSVAATATGLSGTPTWSIVYQPGSDPLPAGLALNESTGILSGTPTAAGSSFFSIRVVDGNDLAVAQSPQVSLTVSPAFSISGMGSTYYGRVGNFLALDLPTAQGQVGGVTYTLSLQTGTLPAGFSLVDPSTGQIRGVPSAPLSTTQATLTARDGFDNKTAVSSFTLGIRQQLTIGNISNVALRNDTPVGTAFAPTASNLFFAGAALWSINGTLPNGVGFNAATGALTGAPTGYAVSQTFTGLTVTLRDVTDGSEVTSAPFDIVVNTGISVATTQPTVSLRAGSSLTAAQPTATGLGGTGTWSLATRAGQPQPYTIAASTGVVTISPASSAAGTWVYDLIVTDSADNRMASTQVTASVVAATTISYAANTAIAPSTPLNLIPTVANKLGNLQFSLASGTLPSGITLDGSTGAITGSTAVTGPFTVTVRGTDIDGYQAVSNSVRVSVSNAPDVYLASIPAGKVGRPFALSTTTNVASVTWTLTGTLPAGLAFNTATGAITGTPTTVGTSGNLTINARNNATSITGSSETFTISVTPGNAISIASAAPKWRQGLGATTTLAIANATGSVGWSIASGVLPAGVTLNASTGAISGTPSQSGNYAINVLAVDSENASASLTVNLAVEVGPRLSYTPSSMRPNVLANVAPSTQYLLGVPTWTLVSGTPPTGLTLNTANGTISGTPTTASATPSVLTIRLTDTDGATATATVSLLVSENAFVVDAGGTSFSTVVGEAFTLNPIAYIETQVVNQYVSWAVVGSLPNGLTFDPITGVVSGRTTSFAVGSKTFSITATYNQATASTPTLTLAIADRPTPTVSVPQTSLTVARGSVASIQPTVANAVGTVSWTLDSGTLPPGTTLSPTTGLVTGAVATNGTYQFKIRATDQSKFSASPTITVVVQDGMDVSITELSSNNKVGKVYLANLSSTGGTGSVVWSVVQGQLPPGISLSTQSASISGTSWITGTWVVRLRAVDSVGATKDLSHTITISSGPSISTVTNQTVLSGQPFGYTPIAAGTSTPVTWSVVGTLPDGISMPNPSTGVLTGTATTAGTVNGIQLAVTDADGLSAVSNVFSITVIPTSTTLALTYSPVIKVKQGEPVTIAPALTGATAATQSYTLQHYSGGSWTNSSAGFIPAGLSFNNTTGVLSGSPTGTSSPASAYRVFVTDNRTPSPASATSNQFTFSYAPQAMPKVSLAPSYEVVRGQDLTIRPTITDAVGAVTITLQYVSGGTWSNYSAGILPSGMSYASATGTISGAPVAATAPVAAYRYYVVDSRGLGAFSNQFSINILPWATPQIRYVENTPLPRGQFVSIAPILNDVSGTRTFTLSYNYAGTWSSCSQSNCVGTLPAGLAFNTSDGTISGTLLSQTATFATWRVYMVETRAGQTIGALSNQFALNVSNWVNPTLSMDSTLVFKRGVASSRAPTVQGVTGTLGSFQLYYHNGSGFQTCNPSNCVGTLPGGLSFNTNDGTISGTTTGQAATFQSWYMRATETRQAQSIALVSNAFTVNVENWQLPTISYPERSTYVSGQPFSISPTVKDVTGTLGNYQFYYYNGAGLTACSGTCNITGLSFNTTTGVISGTPTGTASFAFVAYVTETRLGQGISIPTKSFTIGPAPAAGPTLTYGSGNVVEGAVNQPLDVAPTLSTGTVTGAYTLSTRTVATQTGTGDFNSTSLPSGVTFNTTTGRFTATAIAGGQAGTWRAYRVCAPTTGGTACTPELIFRITDRIPVSIEMSTYIDVQRYGSVDLTPVVRNAVGAVTFARAQILTSTQVSTGGPTETAPTTWPTGISFDTATGRIYGAPTTAGTYRGFTISATDSQGTTYRATTPEIVIRVSELPAFTVSAPAVVETMAEGVVDVRPTVENAYGAVTWSSTLTTNYNGAVNDTGIYMQSTLPSGLGYTPGRISGTVLATASLGDYRGYRICGTDQASRTACTDEIVIRVAARPSLTITTPSVVRVAQGGSVTMVPTVSNAVGSLTWASNYSSNPNGLTAQSNDYVQAALPGSLTYSAIDGSIGGLVPLNTQPGIYRGYIVRAYDSRNVTVSSKEIAFEVVTVPTLVLSAPQIVDIDRGSNVTIAATVSNAQGTVVWNGSLSTNVAGTAPSGTNEYTQTALPTGLGYSSITGAITGTLSVSAPPGRYRGYRIGARDTRSAIVYTEEIILNVR